MGEAPFFLVRFFAARVFRLLFDAGLDGPLTGRPA
jgi:hypothetical protein